MTPEALSQSPKVPFVWFVDSMLVGMQIPWLYSRPKASQDSEFLTSTPGIMYPDTAAVAAKSLQSCPTLRPHRRQPTRLCRPWNSPGKNTGVGCHFLLHCVKVKSEK